MTCLVGYTPLRLPHPAGHHLTNDTSQGTSHRNCESSHRTWTFKTTVIKTTRLPGLPTTDVNHRLLGKTNQMGTHLPFGHPQPVFCFHYYSCTFQYSRWSTIDAKRTWQPNYTGLPVSWKYLLYFEFSVYSLFFAIYQTTEIFYSVAFIPQE